MAWEQCEVKYLQRRRSGAKLHAPHRAFRSTASSTRRLARLSHLDSTSHLITRALWQLDDRSTSIKTQELNPKTWYRTARVQEEQQLRNATAAAAGSIHPALPPPLKVYICHSTLLYVLVSSRFKLNTMVFFLFAFALVSISVSSVVAEYTNLPDVPPGVFNVSARIEIQSTVAAAWDALTNLPAYPEWNPFVRYALALSPTNLTLPDQRPIEHNRLLFRVQIPPLALPVDRGTPDNPLNTQVAYENVTHVQPELGRLAWEYKPDVLLQGERWQALSTLENGKLLYESREVYSGALASFLQETMGKGLQEAFQGQANGLKLLLERTS